MKRLYPSYVTMSKAYRGLLLGCLFFLASILLASAQGNIVEMVDLRNVSGEPQPDNIVLCANSDTVAIIVAASAIASDGTLSINFPDHVQWNGYAAVVDQMGNTTTPLIVNASASTPVFNIPDIDDQTYFKFYFTMKADCELITDLQAQIPVELTYTINYLDANGVNQYDSYTPFQEYNASFFIPVVNILSVTPQTNYIAAGQQVVRDIVISQDGINAYVDNVLFSNDYDGANMNLISLELDGNLVPVADYTDNGNSYEYLINLANLLYEGQTITIRETFELTATCEGANFLHNYKASYICTDTGVECPGYGKIGVDIIIQGNSYQIDWVQSQDTYTFCNQTRPTFTATNVSTGDPATANISDLEIIIPYDFENCVPFDFDNVTAAGSDGIEYPVAVTLDSIGYYNNFFIFVYDYFWTISLADANSTQLTGSNALQDLDGDGFADDLAHNDYITFYFPNNTLVEDAIFDATECANSRASGNSCNSSATQRQVNISFSACGSTYTQTETYDPTFFIMGTSSDNTPPLPCGGGTAPLSYCFWLDTSPNMEECADGNAISLSIAMPTSFGSIAFMGNTLSASEYNYDAANQILTVTPTNGNITYNDPSTNKNMHCFTINDVLIPSATSYSFPGEITYTCSDNTTGCTESTSLCVNRFLSANGCGGGTCPIVTTSLTTERLSTTTGWTDETMQNHIDPADMEQYVLPCDSIRLTTTGKLTRDLIASDTLMLLLGDGNFVAVNYTDISNPQATLYDAAGNAVASCGGSDIVIQNGPSYIVYLGNPTGTAYSDWIIDLSCLTDIAPALDDYTISFSGDFKMGDNDYWNVTDPSYTSGPFASVAQWIIEDDAGTFLHCPTITNEGWEYLTDSALPVYNTEFYSQTTGINSDACQLTNTAYIYNRLPSNVSLFDDEYRPFVYYDSLMLKIKTGYQTYNFNPTFDFTFPNGTTINGVVPDVNWVDTVGQYTIGQPFPPVHPYVNSYYIIKDRAILDQFYLADISDPFALQIDLTLDLPDKCESVFDDKIIFAYNIHYRDDWYAHEWCPDDCVDNRTFSFRVNGVPNDEASGDFNNYVDYSNWNRQEPQVTFQNTPIINAGSSTVTFDFQVCNTLFDVGDAFNSWIGYQSDVFTYEVMDIIDLDNGGTSIVGYDYSHLDGNYNLGLIEAGDLAFGDCRNFQMTVRLRTCDPTDILFWVGNHCQRYPDDPRDGTHYPNQQIEWTDSLTVCFLDKSGCLKTPEGLVCPNICSTYFPNSLDLEYNCFDMTGVQRIEVLPSELQINILEEPDYLTPLCDTSEFIFEVKSVRDGAVGLVDVYAYLPLSGGIYFVPNSWEMIYPADQNWADPNVYTSIPDFVPTGNPNINGEEFYFDFSTLVTDPLEGITGPTPEGNRVYFKVKVFTDCNYEAGGFIKFFAEGTNGCDEVIETKIAASDPYYVQGTDPAQFNEYITTMEQSTPNECTNQNTFAVNIFDLAPLPVQANETFCLTFPPEFTYIPGSFAPSAPATWPFNPSTTTTTDGLTRVCVDLPEGHTGFMQVTFDAENSTCEGMFALEIMSQTNLDCYDTACELDVITNIGREYVINIDPYYEIVDIDASIYADPNCSGEQVDVDVTIANNSTVDINGNTTINVWYDANTNGIVDPNIDVLAAGTVYTNSIPAGGQIMENFNFLAPYDATCNLLLEVMGDECPCQSTFEQVIITDFGLPESLTQDNIDCFNDGSIKTSFGPFELYESCILESYDVSLNAQIIAGDYVDFTFSDRGDVVSVSMDYGTNPPNFVAAEIYINIDRGCGVFTDTIKVIRIRNDLDVTITSEVVENCEDGPLCYQLDAQIAGFEGVADYISGVSWSPTTGLSATDVLNPIACPSVDTEYTLSISIVNELIGAGSDCSFEASFPVVAQTNTYEYNIELGDTLFTCPNEVVDYSLVSSIAPIAGATYTWSPSIGLSNPTIANPAFTTATDQTYTLTVNLPNGCEATDDLVIAIYDLPKAGEDIDTFTACINGSAEETSINLNDLLEMDATTGGTWSAISPPPGNSFDPSTNTLNSAGLAENVSYTFQYVVTDNDLPNACNTDTALFTITTITCVCPTQLDSIIAVPSQICGNDSIFDISISTDNTVANAIQFIYSTTAMTDPYDGSQTGILGTTTGNGTTASLTGAALPANHGNTTIDYYIYAIYNPTPSNSACLLWLDTVISVLPYPKPSLSATGETTFCEGDSVVLTASIGLDNYDWYNDSVLIQTGTSNTLTANVTGEYVVVGTDNNGCSNATDTISITVHPEPTLLVEIEGSDTFCDGGEVTISATPGFDNYTWYLNDILIYDGLLHEGPIGVSGTFMVIVTDENGCIWESNEVNITVNPTPAPIVNINGEPTLCEGDMVELYVTGTYSQIQWYMDGDSIIGANTATYLATESGDYSVYVSDNNACEGISDGVSITVYDNPEPVINASGGDFVACVGQPGVELTADLGFIQYDWYQNGTLLQSNNNNTLLATVSGTYTVIVTDNNGCSGTSAEATVTIAPPPLPMITASANNICLGETVTLMIDPPNLNYLWSSNDLSLSCNDCPNPTATPQVSSLYSVIVTDANGCSARAEVYIEVNEDPSPNISYESNEACEGETVTLEASPGYGQYTWYNQDDDIVASGSNNTFTTDVPGSYYVVVDDRTGCQGASKPIQVILHSPPELELGIVGNQFGCNDEPVLLVATEGFESYTWYYNDQALPGGLPNGENYQLLASQAGVYSLVITDENGCTVNSVEYEIAFTEIEPPVIELSDDPVLCKGESITLSIPGDYDNVQWLVNGNPIPDGNGTSITTNQQGTYTVIITNNEGCNAISEQITITFPPIIAPTILVEDEGIICEDDEIDIFIDIDGEFDNIQWLVNGNPIPDANGTQYTATQPGTYSIVVTNEEGCRGTSNMLDISLAEVPPIELELAGNGEVCEGEPVELSVSGEYEELIWYVNGNPTSHEGNTLTATTSGIYSVHGFSDIGCEVISDGIEVIVKSLPDPDLGIVGDNNFCDGEKMTIITDEGYSSYSWYLDGELISENDQNTFTTNQAGLYEVVITNEAGCTGTSNSIQIAVGENPQPSVILNGSPNLCEGESIDLEVLGNFSDIQWYFNGSPIGNNGNIFQATQSGIYTVYVSDKAGCDGKSDDIVLDFSPIPEPNIAVEGDALFACETDEPITLYADEGFNQYDWFVNNSLITSGTASSIQVTETGTYTVAVYTANDCSNVSDALQIIIGDTPNIEIDLIDGNTLCKGTSINLAATTGLANYQWFYNGNLIASGSDAQISVNQAGNYLVIGTNTDGCSQTSDVVNIQLAPIKPPSIVLIGDLPCEGETTQLSINGNYEQVQWFFNGQLLNGETGNSLIATQEGNYSVNVENTSGCNSNSNIFQLAYRDCIPPVVEPEQIFDLALIKQLADGQATTVSAGDVVTFTISVFNQGDITAYNIEIIDYIPTGLLLADSDWTAVGNYATTTIAGPLAAGASASVDISLMVDPDFEGGSIENIAEITGAEDENGDPQEDEDSTPDNDPENDGQPENDATDNTNDDEDDHDPEIIIVQPEEEPEPEPEDKIFDLALIKQLAEGQVATVALGDLMTFTITVFNQGDIAAYNIEVIDYLPNELTLVDPDWEMAGNYAVTTLPGPLAAGESVSIDITVMVDPDFEGGSIENIAEITGAEDENGDPQEDEDSTPDNDPENDGKPEDDATDNSNGDEDDQDPAIINVQPEEEPNPLPEPEEEIFDLALIKQLDLDQPAVVEPGDFVQYNITLYNQGDLPAYNIEIVDYIPTGFDLVDTDWELVESYAYISIPGPLMPGANISIPITLLVNSEIEAGTYENMAEIAGAEDENGNPQTDHDSKPDDDPNNDGDATDDVTDNTNGDEDDHDPASIEVFTPEPETPDKPETLIDLALTKQLAFAQTTMVHPGDEVTYVINVTNEGNVALYQIEIVDYLPAGFLLNDPAWSLTDDGMAMTSIEGPLMPNASIAVFIHLIIDPNYSESGAVVNYAEITGAADENGNPVEDNDSDWDTIPDNETGDEDDHDDASINVEVNIEVTEECALTVATDIRCEDDAQQYFVHLFTAYGIPPYDIQADAAWSIDGDFIVVGPFETGSVYNIMVTDAEDCSITLSDQPTPCTKLPLELISFDGTVLPMGNQLEWITFAEIDHDHYSLERSVDGENYTTIATLIGEGSPTTSAKYQFLDKAAPSGLSYYRLKSVDTNGQTEIAGTITLVRGEVGLGIHSIVPVPAKDFVRISFTDNKAEWVEISLIDITGKVVFRTQMETHNGLNTINIDLQDFSAGMYIVTIDNNEQPINSKLLVR